MLKLRTAVALLATVFLASSAQSATITLGFDDVGLVHGSVVDSQYAGVTISAINLGGGPDLAVAFDSNASGTADEDLEFGAGWSGGNLAPSTRLGNLLIIQENSLGCADLVCDSPDDEGSRPAGTLIFDFSTAVTSFGFDLVDVESTVAEHGAITFFDGGTSTTIAMSTFLAGLTLGNQTANTVTPFLVANLAGLSQITRVELDLGGSAAIDNVTFELVPEPGTAALVAFGLCAFAARRRALHA